MAAHLSYLPTCQNCGAAAFFTLRNAVNAVNGHYCKRHGPPALKRFWDKVPDHAPAKESQAEFLKSYRTG